MDRPFSVAGGKLCEAEAPPYSFNTSAEESENASATVSNIAPGTKTETLAAAVGAADARLALRLSVGLENPEKLMK